MKYLKDEANEIVEKHADLFKSNTRCTEEEFLRDSEAYSMLQEIIEINFESIEAYYDQASMGQVSRQTD